MPTLPSAERARLRHLGSGDVRLMTEHRRLVSQGENAPASST